MIESHQMASMELISAFQGGEDEEEKFFTPETNKTDKTRITSIS